MEKLLQYTDEEITRIAQKPAGKECVGNVDIVIQSLARSDEGWWFLGRYKNDEPRLFFIGRYSPEDIIPIDSCCHGISSAFIMPCDHHHAKVLRARFSWLVPQPAGLKLSFGAGDRLGLATPGHIRGIQDSDVFPVLAQQSIREMERTHRTPRDVMDDALWGVFHEGYQNGFGSDADHLKTEDDVRLCAAAGFTMYTIDPGDHVVDDADTMETAAIGKALSDDMRACANEYADKEIQLEKNVLRISQTAAYRALVKYGAAIDHAVRMADVIRREAGDDADIEMSVDETATPTTPAEHFIIASELKKRGVKVTSLAPRLCGEWEKGVDFRGDFDAFTQEIAVHAEIARACGPYKLSLHSGSDKFTAYPPLAAACKNALHVKTAGTSYLEAVRTLSHIAPALFRNICTCAYAHYTEDRATYHVSAELERIPPVENIHDDELRKIFLNTDDGRQVLHVTYGTILHTPEIRPEFFTQLQLHPEEHYTTVARHIRRHIDGMTAAE